MKYIFYFKVILAYEKLHKNGIIINNRFIKPTYIGKVTTF